MWECFTPDRREVISSRERMQGYDDTAFISSNAAKTATAKNTSKYRCTSELEKIMMLKQEEHMYISNCESERDNDRKRQWI